MERFTAERRARFLELLDEGQTVRQACVAVGVSPTTVHRWDRLGIEGANADAIAFSAVYDEGRERRASAAHRAGATNRFTAGKRTEFLVLIAAGRTLAQACDEVGISSVTVQTWNVRGDAQADEDAAEFARLYALALDARPPAPPSPQLAIGVDAVAGAPPALDEASARGEAVIKAAASRPAAHKPLSIGDLVELLERQARKGAVGAIKLLLERPWERRADADDDENAAPSDPFDDLAPIDLEQYRQRA